MRDSSIRVICRKILGLIFKPLFCMHFEMNTDLWVSIQVKNKQVMIGPPFARDGSTVMMLTMITVNICTALTMDSVLF